MDRFRKLILTTLIHFLSRPLLVILLVIVLPPYNQGLPTIGAVDFTAELDFTAEFVGGLPKGILPGVLKLGWAGFSFSTVFAFCCHPAIRALTGVLVGSLMDWLRSAVLCCCIKWFTLKANGHAKMNRLWNIYRVNYGILRNSSSWLWRLANGS